MYFGLSHDILPEVTIEDEEVNKLSKGLDYMAMAAKAMERSALVFMAQSYEFGSNGANLDPDQALYWYEYFLKVFFPQMIVPLQKIQQKSTR